MPHRNLLDALFLEPSDVLDVGATVEGELGLGVAVAVFVCHEDGCAAEGKAVHAEGEVEGFVFDHALVLGPVAAARADGGEGGFGEAVGEEGVLGDGGTREHLLLFFSLHKFFFFFPNEFLCF